MTYLKYKGEIDRTISECENNIQILIRAIEKKSITDKEALWRLKVVHEKIKQVEERLTIS